MRYWWNRFGPMFAAEIRRKRVEAMRQLPHWRWPLDEMVVKITDRETYKQRRLEALTEWRSVLA